MIDDSEPSEKKEVSLADEQKVQELKPVQKKTLAEELKEAKLKSIPSGNEKKEVTVDTPLLDESKDSKKEDNQLEKSETEKTSTAEIEKEEKSSKFLAQI